MTGTAHLSSTSTLIVHLVLGQREGFLGESSYCRIRGDSLDWVGQPDATTSVLHRVVTSSR